MKIDGDICIACGVCIPYCPMGAISLDGVAVIDQDECVDCGVCLKSGGCPVDCIIFEPAIRHFQSQIQLEALREGHDLDGRIYTISITATDGAGNSATAETTVTVPHDCRNGANNGSPNSSNAG